MCPILVSAPQMNRITVSFPLCVFCSNQLLSRRIKVIYSNSTFSLSLQIF